MKYRLLLVDTASLSLLLCSLIVLPSQRPLSRAEEFYSHATIHNPNNWVQYHFTTNSVATWHLHADAMAMSPAWLDSLHSIH